MVDETQFLIIPLELCRDVRLIGGTALSTKLMLVMEAARSPHDEAVTMPVWRLAQAMATKPEYVRAAAMKLRDVKCSIVSPDDGGRDTFDVLEPDGVDVGLGKGATVSLRTTDGWRQSCERRREVAVPLDEVRALTTRSGILTRLRVAALLHGREVASEPRVRVSTAALPDYTGYDGDGGHTLAVEKWLVPGLNDINARSSTVRVAMEAHYRDTGREHSWLHHVELRVTTLSRGARSWHVVRDAMEAVR